VNTKLSNIDPIKRESVATQVARRLVEYIISGEIEPGGRMPSERQLAEAFGVGRSAMREALKSLSMIGLIDVRQGDGTYLKRADAALLPQIIEWGLLIGEQRTLDLVEARQHVEIILAELAAIRRTEADLVDMERCIRRMERASDDEDAFVDADVSFHLKLAEAARNSVLRDIHSSIQALLRAWIGRVIHAEKTTLPSFEEHIPIYEAIRDQDPNRAKEAMEIHMVSATKRLEKTLRAEEERLAETRRPKRNEESTAGVAP
jgi:GntR family transcriptional regulator, transcriptional repressor for pyruvate dehydrogenase complex